jgi:hypothetical protein
MMEKYRGNQHNQMEEDDNQTLKKMDSMLSLAD